MINSYYFVAADWLLPIGNACPEYSDETRFPVILLSLFQFRSTHARSMASPWTGLFVYDGQPPNTVPGNSVEHKPRSWRLDYTAAAWLANCQTRRSITWPWVVAHESGDSRNIIVLVVAAIVLYNANGKALMHSNYRLKYA